MRMQRVVVALGGNALIERHQPPDAAPQLDHLEAAVSALVPVARGRRLAVTHGNGPQVGLLARESADDADLARPYPLDALGAETQGLLGYWLLQALDDALPERDVAAIITRVVVSRSGPAFAHPQKPIGPTYDAATARRLGEQRGWSIAPDGADWRRVVASPEPLAIAEIDLIRRAFDDGTVVVCAGGGGIPVARDDTGSLTGVEAVVDKDLTAALLAQQLGADALLLLTDVDAVSADITDPEAERIHRSTPAALRALGLPAGSMGPKVEAACRFVEQTGAMAAIGHLTAAADLLAGRAGTIITPDGAAP